MADPLEALLGEIRACRLCRDAPAGKALPHEPRPVLRISKTARIGVFGQAPGTRVHASGKPFTDPSGVRLRQWMGISEDEFYDTTRVAILPMGFCFPGLDANGGDLPPRPECAAHWRARVMRELQALNIVLLVGGYAQAWHLKAEATKTVGGTVAQWRAITKKKARPQYWPLPHPSWRNSHWLKQNSWFESELVPALQKAVRRELQS